MYALIYDEFDPNVPEKKIISIHKTREEARKALDDRQETLGRRVWQCHTRIVWVKKDKIREGDHLVPLDFETWGPNDKIPEGEYISDSD